MGASQSTAKVTAHDKAVLDLKVQRDKLKQYQKRLQISLTNEHEIAKRALEIGQKSKAVTALRQKKYQEQLLTKTDAQLINLQELLSTIEFTQIQSQILNSLDRGSVVLKELQKEMTLERVDGIMNRVGEGVTAQREIDEALMSKMSPEEEEEVQIELAALERESLRNVVKVDTTKESVSVPVLPDVPILEPVQEEHVRNAEGREKEERVALAA